MCLRIVVGFLDVGFRSQCCGVHTRKGCEDWCSLSFLRVTHFFESLPTPTGSWRSALGVLFICLLVVALTHADAVLLEQLHPHVKHAGVTATLASCWPAYAVQAVLFFLNKT